MDKSSHHYQLVSDSLHARAASSSTLTLRLLLLDTTITLLESTTTTKEDTLVMAVLGMPYQVSVAVEGRLGDGEESKSSAAASLHGSAIRHSWLSDTIISAVMRSLVNETSSSNTSVDGCFLDSECERQSSLCVCDLGRSGAALTRAR